MSFDLAQRRAHRVYESTGREVRFDQVRDDLGVGVSAERVPGIGEPLLERDEVLDDAVVDDDDPSRAVTVRVGIVLARFAMRRPARVADPEVAGDWLRGEARLEVPELSLRAADLQSVLRDDRDSRAVVAAIFELSQPFDQQRNDVPLTRIPDDSAHPEPHSPVHCPFRVWCGRDAPVAPLPHAPVQGRMPP